MFEEFDPHTQSRMVRDERRFVRVFSHPQHIVIRGPTPRLAARSYLCRHGHLLGVPNHHLRNLFRPIGHEFIDAPVEYRFLSEKRLDNLTTVAFHQTCCGLPVWEAGLSVTMKHGPFRAIGAHSTLHHEIAVKRHAAAAQSKPLDNDALAQSLGLAGRLKPEATPKISRQRLVIYQHDAERLNHELAPSRRGGAFRHGAPVLPLRCVHPSIRPGQHYVARAVYFAFDLPPVRPLHWVALLEAETASVLLLRPFVENVTGWVFEADPATLGGPPAQAPNAALDRMRKAIMLPRLKPPVNGKQALSGSRVVIADVLTPNIAPPTRAPGQHFKFSARTNDFAAVNAYYNCDRVFQLVEDLGFAVTKMFPGTKFPSRVDHRGHFDKNSPEGNEINAHCAGNASGTGIAYTTFSLADTRNLKQPIGIACDWRIVLHELLGHGLLYNHIHAPLFKFAHSAGDSFAAILNDPDSKQRGRHRGRTFPWLTGVDRKRRRYHDRKVANGWGWSGDIALHPFDPIKDQKGYNNEQILSSTMFRFYRAIGGDSKHADMRRFAARMTCRIMLAAIYSLTPATSPTDATHFAAALMKADHVDWSVEGISGGAYHKVIRWAFEKQGLYQSPAAKKPNNREGAPPPVDIYIEDGRHGEYAFQSDHCNCQAIWNRRRKDGGLGHQTPTAGQTNYAYVTIKNRGVKPATGVVVRAFQARPQSKRLFPRDYEPMKPGRLTVARVAPNSSTKMVVGPFAWMPSGGGQDYLLMIASADGDPSNVDNFVGRESIPDWRLVPNDNNIGQRRVSIVKEGRRPGGRR
jgi:hypothetical protein